MLANSEDEGYMVFAMSDSIIADCRIPSCRLVTVAKRNRRSQQKAKSKNTLIQFNISIQLTLTFAAACAQALYAVCKVACIDIYRTSNMNSE